MEIYIFFNKFIWKISFKLNHVIFYKQKLAFKIKRIYFRVRLNVMSNKQYITYVLFVIWIVNLITIQQVLDFIFGYSVRLVLQINIYLI